MGLAECSLALPQGQCVGRDVVERAQLLDGYLVLELIEKAHIVEETGDGWLAFADAKLQEHNQTVAADRM